MLLILFFYNLPKTQLNFVNIYNFITFVMITYCPTNDCSLLETKMPLISILFTL